MICLGHSCPPVYPLFRRFFDAAASLVYLPTHGAATRPVLYAKPSTYRGRTDRYQKAEARGRDGVGPLAVALQNGMVDQAHRNKTDYADRSIPPSVYIRGPQDRLNGNGPGSCSLDEPKHSSIQASHGKVATQTGSKQWSGMPDRKT
jgi:hypothetical protein